MDNEQYTRLSTDALVNKENISAASNQAEEGLSHHVARGGMSKTEIVGRIQEHIEAFGTQHHWPPGMSRVCTAGARMYVFSQISSVPEENTMERMSLVNNQLNKIIEELLEDTAHQHQGTVFFLTDLYPKAKRQAEEVIATHGEDKNMKR